MRHHKTIARILLILPIINFTLALPLAVQESRQRYGDVVPDVAITTSAKRGDEMENYRDMNFESLSGKAESSSAAHPPSRSARAESDPERVSGNAPLQSPASSTAPGYGSIDPHQMGTSEDQQMSPEVSKSPSLDVSKKPEEWRSPSLDHFVVSEPEEWRSPSMDHFAVSEPQEWRSPSFDHFVVSEPEASKPTSLDHIAEMSTVSETGSTTSEVSQSTTGPLMETTKSECFLCKSVFSKLKFWRRISGPGSVRDVVDAGQMELRGLVDTGAAKG